MPAANALSCSLQGKLYPLMSVMADRAESEKQLIEAPECPICASVFTDPRNLPSCGHTICLRCIERLARDKYPGEEIECPICRTDAAIPIGGVKNLQKNYVVANLFETTSFSF